MIKKIIAVFLVIIIIGIIIISSQLGKVIKAAVENVGPQITGTKVTLGNADISLLSGTGSINNLVIGPPQGFKSDVFKLGKTDVELSLSSLKTDTVIIKKLSIINPEIAYEIGLNGTNIKALQDNITKNVAVKQGEQRETAVKDGQEKKVVIELLEIKGAKVMASTSGLGGATVPLPDIQLRNIGKDDGDTSFADAGKKIMDSITQSISQVDLGVLKEELQKGLEDATGALQKGTEGTKDAIEGVGEGVKDATDAIKGLLGK